MNPLIVGGVFEMGKSLIDRLIPNPEAKAKAQMELLKMEQDGELQLMSARMSAIVAEAKSADPWTSRARPTFMYVFYLIMIALVLVGPFVGIFFPEGMDQFFVNVAHGFAAIPEAAWWTFSAGYLGYAGARTYEKVKK